MMNFLLSRSIFLLWVIVLLLSQESALALANQTKIMNDVKSCPYNISEYVRGVFDCSNMAAMLYDWLSEKGHRCRVVYIENWTYDIKHNFIFVDGYAVEPTTKDWAWWYYNKWITIDKIIYLKRQQMKGPEFTYPHRW